MKNPIYIHDASLISPLGNNGFGQSNSFFCTQNGVPVGRIDAHSETRIEELRGENNQYKKLDRSTLLALLAARKLKLETEDVAVNIGSSRGATGIWEEFHAAFLKTGELPVATSPLTTLGNISSWVAQDLGTTSVAFSHSITCATAAHSILNAIAWLESDMATFFIAGGAEAPLTDFTIAQMKALRIYSQEQGDYKCRALDLEKQSNTMVLGEAAACFLLSKKESANGIRIIGYGAAMEPLKSATSMTVDGLGFQKSMKQAMAGHAATSVDAIVTHAPGTILGDSSEMNAITFVFDNQCPILLNNKWQIGHCLGASAAVNLYMAMMVLQEQSYFEIPYLKSNDQNLSVNQPNLKRILVNSSGFGGNCVSILVEKD